MTFYAGEEGKKEQELRAFASTRLLNDSMEPIRGCGEGDERMLLREFWRCCSRLCLTAEDVARRHPGRDPKNGRRHGRLRDGGTGPGYARYGGV